MTLKTRPVFGGVFALLLAWVPAASLEAQVLFTEVLFDPSGVDTGQQLVELRNLGDSPAEIGGYWLSFKPAAWQFPAPLSIPAGEIITVHLNKSGTRNRNDYYTGTAGMRNLRREDSLALFSLNLFTDKTKLLDYVEWGSSGQAGEDVAVEAQKWSAGETVSLTAFREGASIARQSTLASSAAWCPDGSPSLGQSNEACSTPQARSPVRLNEVQPGAGGGVELKNVGTVIEDLEGKWLLFRAGAYRFPVGAVLLPGEVLFVKLGASGTDVPGSLYHTGPAIQPLVAQDSVAISAREGEDSTQLIDFVQWTATGMTYEGAAVLAGLWQAGQTVDTSDLKTAGSVVSAGEAVGAARWQVDNTPTPGAQNDAAHTTPVILNEVLVAPSTGAAQAVELYNRGASQVDVSGWNLCAGSDGAPGVAACAALPANTRIAAGALLVVRLGIFSAGAGEVALPTFPHLDRQKGELALLVSSKFSSAGNYLDYLRWGDAGAALEPQALQAGLWTSGDTIDVSEVVNDSSIAYQGPGDASDAYRIDSTPSLGQPNAEKPPAKNFRRFDCNQDISTDISDPILMFDFLFGSGGRPTCEDACDSNDDGSIDISDAVHFLSFLFLGGPDPKAPGASCGPDPSDDGLSCAAHAACN